MTLDRAVGRCWPPTVYVLISLTAVDLFVQLAATRDVNGTTSRDVSATNVLETDDDRILVALSAYSFMSSDGPNILSRRQSS